MGLPEPSICLQSTLHAVDLTRTCSGLHCAPPPPNSHLPRTSEWDLIGKRVFADVIKLRIGVRSPWSGLSPKPNNSVLIKDRKGHRDMGRKGASRSWERQEELSPRVFRGSTSLPYLASRHPASRAARYTQRVAVCRSSPRKVVQNPGWILSFLLPFQPRSGEATALTAVHQSRPVVSSWPHLSLLPPPMTSLQPPGPFPAFRPPGGTAAFVGRVPPPGCLSPDFPSAPVVFALIHLLGKASPDRPQYLSYICFIPVPSPGLFSCKNPSLLKTS